MPERDMEGKLFPLHDRPLSFLNRALRAQFKNAMKRFPLREIGFPCVGIVPALGAHVAEYDFYPPKRGMTRAAVWETSLFGQYAGRGVLSLFSFL